MNILISDIGRVPYREAWSLQEQIQQRLIDDKLGVRRGKKKALEHDEVLLLVEHPHVYTLGKSGDDQNMLMSEQQLEHLEAEFVKIDRGGDITYHGPGQIVGYPILDLSRRDFGIKQYIWNLEQSLIDTLAEYEIEGQRLDDFTGVWVGDAKVCAIGIKASRYVTMHGFALNVNTQLEYFDYIVPCGINHKSVTSMQQLLGRRVESNDVKMRLIRHISDRFGVTPDVETPLPELQNDFSHLNENPIRDH
jgi:lipoyl(octanoyl) transferase